MYNKGITIIGIQGRILSPFLEVLIIMTTKKKKKTLKLQSNYKKCSVSIRGNCLILRMRKHLNRLTWVTTDCPH